MMGAARRDVMGDCVMSSHRVTFPGLSAGLLTGGGVGLFLDPPAGSMERAAFMHQALSPFADSKSER